MIGLHLNQGRIRWQRAFEVAQGIGISLSKEKLPQEYFDAIAANERQAKEMAEEDALAKMEMMAEAERRSGGNTGRRSDF